MQIEVTADGPYRVTGAVPLARQSIETDLQGQSVGWQEGERFPDSDAYELCRCGHSKNKPFCDGTHERIGFQGKETAGQLTYLALAEDDAGPELTLTDAEPLCAFARFCDAYGQVWNLVYAEGKAADVRRGAALCPSGRLVAWDRQPERARPLEPELPPSIGVVDDPGQGVSGPLWVRGGITIMSADGSAYERRNRVTLCRCGESGNKPFCDGSHAAIGFRDSQA